MAVPIPGVDPDSTPTFPIAINEEWWPLVVGAIEDYFAAIEWDDDDATPAELELLEMRVQTLLAMFAD